MRTFDFEPLSIIELLNSIDKISENISPYTINYNKNREKLQKMKETYKNNSYKFSKKYLIKDFNE